MRIGWSALHDDLEATIERSLHAPSRGKLLARICAVVRPFYAYYEARPRLSRVLLRESLLAKPPWRERFTEQALRVTAHVARLAEQAKARGELAADTHPQLFATAFASFYYFALIGWVQEGVAHGVEGHHQGGNQDHGRPNLDASTAPCSVQQLLACGRP